MSKRALGEQVQAAYSYDGMGAVVAATVGVDVKTLTVDVAVMKKRNGDPCVEEYQVLEDMQVMKNRYAQANIRIVPVIHPPFNAPYGLIISNWEVAMKSSKGDYFLTLDAHNVINASNLGTNNMRVIYVPAGIKSQDLSQNGFPIIPADGIAICAHKFTREPDQPYIDTCFVTPHFGPNDLPSHEVTHLLGEEHVPELWNLMCETLYPGDDLWGTKRLTQAQVDGIRSDKRKKLH